MRATYLSAYCVQDIVHDAGDSDLTIFEDAATGINVILTSNPTPHLHILYRQLALMDKTLRGGIGNPLAADFADQLMRKMETIAKEHAEIAHRNPVIVIQILCDVADAVIPADARDVLDFVLCLDGYDKDALHSSMQSKISAILTAVRIASGQSYEYRTLCDGSYLIANDGRVVHSARSKLNVRMHISAQLRDDQVTQMRSDIPLALSAGDLNRVMSLHVHSLNTSTDNFRSFISAWTALEILVAKLFDTYQARLKSDLRTVSSSQALLSYLERVESVMKDKHNPVDKFAVLSIYLDEKTGSEDLETFRMLKRTRDKLLHGEELDEHTLPTSDAWDIFDKYLQRHLRHNA